MLAVVIGLNHPSITHSDRVRHHRVAMATDDEVCVWESLGECKVLFIAKVGQKDEHVDFRLEALNEGWQCGFDRLNREALIALWCCDFRCVGRC